jgi:hypothetical protein
MSTSKVFLPNSSSMLNGGRIVKVTVLPVDLAKSPASALAPTWVEPTLSTRTSAPLARPADARSENAIIPIWRKRIDSSRHLLSTLAYKLARCTSSLLRFGPADCPILMIG